jgi:hypothetical protein
MARINRPLLLQGAVPVQNPPSASARQRPDSASPRNHDLLLLGLAGRLPRLGSPSAASTTSSASLCNHGGGRRPASATTHSGELLGFPSSSSLMYTTMMCKVLRSMIMLCLTVMCWSSQKLTSVLLVFLDPTDYSFVHAMQS